MNRILHLDETGKVLITTPVEGVSIEQAIERLELTDYKVIDDLWLPESREFRNAWVDVTDEPKIDICLKTAKDIKLMQLRTERNEALKKTDAELMRALEAQDDLHEIKAKRQALRDATEPLKALTVSGYNDEDVLQQIRDLGVLDV